MLISHQSRAIDMIDLAAASGHWMAFCILSPGIDTCSPEMWRCCRSSKRRLGFPQEVGLLGVQKALRHSLVKGVKIHVSSLGRYAASELCGRWWGGLRAAGRVQRYCY
jgi:hypothetical protein